MSLRRPVLVVVQGGIARVDYCPPGVVVVVKDYDEVPGAAGLSVFTDAGGDRYTRDVITHKDTEQDEGARREAYAQKKEVGA